MSLARKGKKLSENTKKKLSKLHQGKTIPTAQRKTISRALKKWLATHEESCQCAICKVKRGYRPPHNEFTCTCFICKRKRGEIEQYSGENHWNWHNKSGTTALYRRIRKSKKFKMWAKRVLKKDNYTCLMCKKVGKPLYPHHILPFAAFPEHRFDVSNGIALCRSCHYVLHRKNLWQNIYNAAFG